MTKEADNLFGTLIMAHFTFIKCGSGYTQCMDCFLLNMKL